VEVSKCCTQPIACRTARCTVSAASLQALEDDAAATQRKMEAANHLINALAGEEARWTEQSKMFDDIINRLIGDAALASRWGAAVQK
jgi:dynein heavy chain